MVSNLPLENLPRSGVLFMVHSICTEYLCIPYGSHQSLRLALHSPTVSTSVILTLVPVVLSFISTISGSLEQVRLDDGIVDIIHPLRHGDLFSCESQDFVSLALKYKLTGDRPTRLCALNAEVAKEMGKKDIANLWSTVELLLIEQDDSSGIQNFLAQENKQCQEDRQKLEAELRGLGFDAMGHGLSEDVETDAKSVGVPLNQSSPRMLNVSCVPWGYCSPARRKIGRSPFHSTLQSGHSRHASTSPESLALSAHSRISMSASVPNLSSILQAEDRSNSFVGLPGDVSTSPDPLR